MASIQVYTDGSTYPKNPGRGGAACLLLTGERALISGSNLGSQITNNVAELRAIELGLDCLTEFSPGTVEILSDSEYSINVIMGITTAKKNLHILDAIASRIKRLGEYAITFKWVKGHAKDPFNVFTDKLAYLAAKIPDYSCVQSFSREEFIKQGNLFLQSYKEIKKNA